MDGVLFDPAELQMLLAALTSNHDALGARLRTLTLTAKSTNPGVRLHGHYFPFRGGKPTVEEFIELLTTKLVSFCISRKSIRAAHETWRNLPPEKKIEKIVHLRNRAVELFKRAQGNTNKNGEFGEVIAYLLIEHVLKAPQLVAKMRLKTSRQMPVHGSDGWSSASPPTPVA